MNLNCEIFLIFEKNKNGRGIAARREKSTEMENPAEEIRDRRDYFFHSQGNHHLYPDLFSRQEFLDHHPRLCSAMV